ncbi:hypothetical protein HELRODRAFT_94681 [Helobdella robusta]|uniref:Short-chain dehydrogenase/reductase 3 n=1 Tax=Helobdella robusta TaxID=6412 RepID=T1G923_HELRO|nr:hypothetical protein HELRODRAFT_94681 [Helobdella robusta]ESO02602.1 hypothetical protein HELRODRAFT_94681 [Helobdella robusta]
MLKILTIIWCWLNEIIEKILMLKKRKSINGQLVFITGAGGGIGRQLALKFAAENTKLALIDIDKKSCDMTARLVENSYNVKCIPYVCDVSNRDDVKKVAAKVNRDLGEVNILVNNAGIANYKTMLELTEEEIRRLIDVNLLGAFWTIQEFLPEMFRRNGGHIVNISSIGGCLGVALCCDYSASKFGLRGLSESLIEEMFRYKRTGIRVSVVYSSFVDTDLLNKIPEEYSVKLVSPEKLADDVLDGVLRDQKHIFVPKQLWKINALTNLLPTKTMMTLRCLYPIGTKYDEEDLQNVQ